MKNNMGFQESLTGISKNFIGETDRNSTSQESDSKKNIINSYNELLENINIEDKTFDILLSTYPELKDDLDNAESFYDGIKRKISGEPFVNHAIGVAKIVSRVTQDKKTILGALMHDVIEDVKNGEEKLYNKYDLELIELVKSVSEEDKSLSWHEGKEAYINHLSEVGTKSLIISLSDRIYNLRDMILSLKENGLSVFEKFSVGFEDQERFLLNYTSKISEVIENIDNTDIKGKIQKLNDELIVLTGYFSLIGNGE